KRNVCETQCCPSTVNRKNCPLKQLNHLSQPTVFNYVDGPTVTGNPNCYSVGNLFTDWSSYFPREVVECGFETIYSGTAFCRVLCIKVIVITLRLAASVIATFSLTYATYNFSFVDCSVILPLKQKLSAQQSLSSLSLQLPSPSLLSNSLHTTSRCVTS